MIEKKTELLLEAYGINPTSVEKAFEILRENPAAGRQDIEAAEYVSAYMLSGIYNLVQVIIYDWGDADTVDTVDSKTIWLDKVDGVIRETDCPYPEGMSAKDTIKWIYDHTSHDY